MTKIFSLVFDYTIQTVIDSGRHWAREVYRDKKYIFEYTAASAATFLDKNPHLPYTIYTDDVDLIADEIGRYAVSTHNLDIVDLCDKIVEWKSHRYSFWPLVKIVEMHYTGEEHCLKLDNDLTCLTNIDILLAALDQDDAIVWKFERFCDKGRDYWGESYAARKGLGTDKFSIFNTGVLGMPKTKHTKAASDIANYCERLINVDISPVHRFPDKPGVVSKVYSAAEQTAVNYFISREGMAVSQACCFIDHHCYAKTKQGVLDGAAYLRR